MYKCLPFWDPIQIQALGRRCVPRPQALLPLPRPHALLPFLWSHLLQLLYAGTSYSSCPIAAESRATTEEGTDGAGVQRGGQREEETGGRREREEETGGGDGNRVWFNHASRIGPGAPLSFTKFSLSKSREIFSAVCYNQVT